MIYGLFIKRYLFSHQKSVVKILSIISIFGISLGVATMIVVLSVMNGFDKAIEDRNLKALPHLIVKSTSVELKTSLIKKEPRFNNYSKQDVLIRTVEGVFSGAVAYGMTASNLKNIGQKMGQSVEIIEAANGTITTGRPKVLPEPVILGRKEIAMGYDLARSLGIVEGDEVTLISPESLLTPDEAPVVEKFQVKALIKTDISELDGRHLFFDENYFPSRFAEAASLEKGLEARFDDPYKGVLLAAELKESGINQIYSWQDLNQALFYSLKMEKRLMGIFLALTVLISSFSIMSVLYLLVTEKRRDVGVLKSMGAKKNQITQLFLRVGIALGVAGLIFGTALGLLICYLLVRFPIIKLPDVYYDTQFPVLVEPGVIAGIVVFGFFMALLSSILPARLAAEQSPLDIFKS